MAGENWKEVVALYKAVGRGVGDVDLTTGDIAFGSSPDQIDSGGYNYWVSTGLTGSALSKAYYAKVDKYIFANPDASLTKHLLDHYVPDGWVNPTSSITYYDEKNKPVFDRKPGYQPDYWDSDGKWKGNGTFDEWETMMAEGSTAPPTTPDDGGDDGDGGDGDGGWSGTPSDDPPTSSPGSPSEPFSGPTYSIKVKPGDLAWDKIKDIFTSTTMISREKYYTDMIATMDVDEFLTSALCDLTGIPYDELSAAPVAEQEEQEQGITLIIYQDENQVDQFMQYRGFHPDYWDSTEETAVWIAEDSTFADWLVDNGYGLTTEWDFDLTHLYVPPVDHFDELGDFAFSAEPNLYPDYWDASGTWLPVIGTYRAFQYRILWDETPTMNAEDIHYYDETGTYIFTKPVDFDRDHWTTEGTWHEHAPVASYVEWIENKTGEPVDVE